MEPIKTNLDTENVVFTARELDVLACIASGETTSKDIARTLSTSPRTVETHIAHIMSKTETQTRRQIFLFLQSKNLLPQLQNAYREKFQKIPDSTPTNPDIKSSLVWEKLKEKKLWLLMALGLSVLTVVFFYKHHQKYYMAADLMKRETILRRPDLIQRIHHACTHGQTFNLVALVGPGGAGKTTLAKLYAEKYPAQCVGFIEASSLSSMLSSFKNLAENLITSHEQHISLQKILNAPEEGQIKQIISFVYGILDQKSTWLLVFDNVDDLSLCRRFLPPSSYQGPIIITTRDQNVQNNPMVSSIIQVEELSTEESYSLLRSLLPQSYDDRDIRDFVTKLPPFPLDISLAANYVRDAHLSFDAYLERLNHHQPTFHEHEQKLWSEVSNYHQTRYAIISLSTEDLLSRKPIYLELLWTLATIANQNIPLDIFLHTEHTNIIDAWAHDLRSLSFFTDETNSFGHSMVSIHQNTQEILNHYLTTKYGTPPYSRVATTLTHCAEKAMEEGDAFTLRKLIPHFEALQKVVKESNFRLTQGMLYYHAGLYVQAQHILEEELTALQSHSKPQYETLLKTMIYLGNTYKELVVSDKAEDMLQKALSLCQQHFRNEPTQTIKLLVSLSHIHRRLGDFKKAEDLCNRSLGLCEQYASTDYSSLSSIHMAQCVIQREQGHYRKAEEHIQQSLQLLEKHLPDQKLDYAHALRLFGHVYSDEGLYQQACQLYEQSLDLFIKHDLPHHPKALWLLAKLGTIHRRLGNVDKAHDYLNQAEHNTIFSSSPVVMGLTHHERAHLYVQEGKYEQALAEAQKSLQVYTQLYGDKHVKTRRALNLIGYVLMHQNKLEEAEAAMQQALQTFGEKGLPIQCQALDYLSELYRRRACLEAPTQFETLKQKSLDYVSQAISLAEQYFPHDSSHLQHLAKQKERITETQPGDRISLKNERHQ